MPSVRRRPLLLAATVAAVVALFVGVAVALSGDGSQRYEAAEFSFLYPEEWQEIEGVDFPASAELTDGRSGQHVVGIDLDNWVSVFPVDLGFVVDGSNVRDVLPTYRSFVRRAVAGDPEAELVQDATVVEKGSLPGVQFRISAVSQQGNRVTETVTSLFSGTSQFLVTCNARPDLAVVAREGCEQALRTLAPKGRDG